MDLGIFAKTFPGTDPATVMKAAAGAGYTTVQYNMACSGLSPMPDEITREQADRVAEAARQTGVRIVACSATYNMIHPDPEVRSRGLGCLEVIASACSSMGCDALTLCTGTRDATDQWRAHADNQTKMAWDDLLRSMEAAVRIAEAHNLTLGIEPELANVVNSAQAARRLMDEIQSPRIGIVLDPANLFEVETLDRQRSIVSEAIELLGDRIIMGHAKDRLPGGGFTAAGQGVLDYEYYLRAMFGTGFDGPLVAHGLDVVDAPLVADFLSLQLGNLAA